MQLVSARLARVGPFDELELPFCDEQGRPRRLSVIHGAPGVGKTMIVAAIAATRPGHAVVLSPSLLGWAPGVGGRAEVPPTARCEWALGDDDPERPHPLVVATPGAELGLSTEDETFRRREQSLFDRRAAAGGFAWLALPANRWFSRQPVSLSAPHRTIGRYDVRAGGAPDDATRADLCRDTKQALAYAAIASALADAGGDRGRNMGHLGRAMRTAVEELVALAGFSYVGLDAATFEPVFRGDDGRERPFDALPTRARHLVAFAALPVRLLWAAYPSEDPRQHEAVVAIDEVDLAQDAATLAGLPRALTTALPNVQWLLTTSSPAMASSVDVRDVIALRRSADPDRVELHVGETARTH
jgi:hypothetical protein